jgi:hypothetical protein
MKSMARSRFLLVLGSLLVYGCGAYASSYQITPVVLSSTNQLEHHIVLTTCEYKDSGEYDFTTGERHAPTNPPNIGITIMLPERHNGKSAYSD